jgi:hypothetical protein
MNIGDSNLKTVMEKEKGIGIDLVIDPLSYLALQK